MKKIIILITVIIAIASCNVRKSTAIYITGRPSYDGEVKVLVKNSPVPAGAVLLGTVYVGDTGFTVKCNYETVQKAALTEAAKMGGNYFLITAHSLPGFLSSCHRLRGNVYWVDETNSACQ